MLLHLDRAVLSMVIQALFAWTMIPTSKQASKEASSVLVEVGAWGRRVRTGCVMHFMSTQRASLEEQTRRKRKRRAES